MVEKNAQKCSNRIEYPIGKGGTGTLNVFRFGEIADDDAEKPIVK